MIEVKIIRSVFPRDTMQCFADLMRLPLDTARWYLYRGFSPKFLAERRRELAVRLLIEMEKQDRIRDSIRESLRAMLNEETGRNLAITGCLLGAGKGALAAYSAAVVSVGDIARLWTGA